MTISPDSRGSGRAMTDQRRYVDSCADWYQTPPLYPPDIPEHRARRLHFSRQTLSIRRRNLELTQCHGGHLGIILRLDCHRDLHPRLVVLRVQPILCQRLDLRVLVPAEPARRANTSEWRRYDRIQNESAGRPGVKHGPTAFLHRLLGGAALHHGTPIRRLQLRLDADLLEEIERDVAQRTDRGEISGVDDDGFRTVVGSLLDQLPRRLDVALLHRQIGLDAIRRSARVLRPAHLPG